MTEITYEEFSRRLMAATALVIEFNGRHALCRYSQTSLSGRIICLYDSTIIYSFIRKIDRNITLDLEKNCYFLHDETTGLPCNVWVLNCNPIQSNRRL